MMGGLKVKDLRKISKEERASKLEELKAELLKLRAAFALGSIPENPSRMKVVRRAIARILTIEREEELKVKGGKR